MTKFPYDLSANPFSKRIMLTRDEILWYKTKFGAIRECIDNIPEKVFDSMANIEEQFLADYRLSPKQMEYIENIVEQYC